MVIGGIIGTVRFHFDMWGGAVIGAMRMEELGSSGHVHLSNTTAALLGDSSGTADERKARFAALRVVLAVGQPGSLL